MAILGRRCDDYGSRSVEDFRSEFRGTSGPMLVVAKYRMGESDKSTAEHGIGEGLRELIGRGANGKRTQVDFGKLVKPIPIPLKGRAGPGEGVSLRARDVVHVWSTLPGPESPNPHDFCCAPETT